jgi:hypothetical protein
LLLRDFHLQSLVDVDYAQFLLNFEGIVLGLNEERNVDVYLYQPCRHLDVPSGLCQVWRTPDQPGVCIHYDDTSCSYRTRMGSQVHPVRPLVDIGRMAWYTEELLFDDERRIISAPAWDTVLEAFSSMPLSREPKAVQEPAPVSTGWHPVALSVKPADGDDDGVEVHRWSDPAVTQPCVGCGAWCCQVLVFNRGRPGDAAQIDFLRYCLGFPNVQVGVADDSWAVVVHTTCRHLDGNRCSVFGTDQRPMKCTYYDAMTCHYREHFGTTTPDDMVLVSFDQFRLLAESIVFDEFGRILALPPVGVIRHRFETEAVATRSG